MNQPAPLHMTRSLFKSASTSGKRSMVTLVVLTLCAAFALPADAAGKLYRWNEPDGAVTFSPTPPADGRAFEEVDPMTLKPRVASTDATSTAPAPSAVESAQAQATPDTSNAWIAPAARPATAESQITRTPAIAAATIERADVSGTSLPAIRADAPRIEVRAPRPEVRQQAATPASQKAQRCGDLRKRVTSLERRLATPLSNEDMDNTIVHMARYQQSYDSHCG